MKLAEQATETADAVGEGAAARGEAREGDLGVRPELAPGRRAHQEPGEPREAAAGLGGG